MAFMVYCCNSFLTEGQAILSQGKFIGNNIVNNLSMLTKKRAGALASRLGRRLTVGAIALDNTATEWYGRGC